MPRSRFAMLLQSGPAIETISGSSRDRPRDRGLQLLRPSVRPSVRLSHEHNQSASTPHVGTATVGDPLVPGIARKSFASRLASELSDRRCSCVSAPLFNTQLSKVQNRSIGTLRGLYSRTTTSCALYARDERAEQSWNVAIFCMPRCLSLSPLTTTRRRVCC